MLDKMALCDLKVEDVFLNCRFVKNHRELALKGVRLALPNFQLVFPHPNLTYDNVLLNSLNDFAVDLPIKSPAHGLGITPKKYYYYDHCCTSRRFSQMYNNRIIHPIHFKVETAHDVVYNV